MEIFINSEGVKITEKGGQAFIHQGSATTPVPLKRAERIWLNNSTTIESGALEVLLQHNVEFIICSREGTPLGSLSPLFNPRGAKARKRQLTFANSPDAKNVVAEWQITKQKRQCKLLEEFLGDSSGQHSQFLNLKGILDENVSQLKAQERLFPEDLQEAYFGRLYLSILSELLPPAFRFRKRSRQPAKDYFNAALNYAFGIMYGIVEGAVRRAGLDPYIGFYHKEREGNPVLVFDAIEPFRPWAERTCLELFRRQEFSDPDFREYNQGWWLADTGKEKLILQLMDFLSEEMPKARNTTRKEYIFKSLRELAQAISQWPG